MNDRFAAQVRQHLLETAVERPSDGQLARVIDGVAATRQRHPATARLTWNPGWIGPIPSSAIRFGLIAAALALATVAGGIMAGGAQQPSSVFEGTWITIDPADGSGMTLVVGPGQTPAVYFEDGYASGLACVNDAVKRFTARGTGQISGNRLVATFPEGGGCGLKKTGVRGVYDYDQRGDTLSDQDGVVWTQALGEQPVSQAPETPMPTTSPEVPAPSATSRPSPEPGAVTYTSAVHGLSIDLPASWQIRPATEPWTGEALSFDSPAADIAFDPALGDDHFLMIASQPYGGLSEDAWRDQAIAWLCQGDAGNFGSRRVDDTRAFARGCGAASATFVFTDTRGYLFVGIGWEDGQWFSEQLETVDLRPEEAVEPSIAAPQASPDLTRRPRRRSPGSRRSRRRRRRPDLTRRPRRRRALPEPRPRLPDDANVLEGLGSGAQALILADQLDAQVTRGGVEQPIDRVARERLRQRACPGRGLWRQRCTGDALAIEQVVDPLRRVAIELDTPEPVQSCDLPARQRTDQELARGIDGSLRPRDSIGLHQPATRARRGCQGGRSP